MPLHQLRVVNVVFARKADAYECTRFLQFMHLEGGLRSPDRESGLQTCIHVFDVHGDGVLEIAKGDRGLGLA